MGKIALQRPGGPVDEVLVKFARHCIETCQKWFAEPNSGIPFHVRARWQNGNTPIGSISVAERSFLESTTSTIW